MRSLANVATIVFVATLAGRQNAGLVMPSSPAATGTGALGAAGGAAKGQ